MMTTVSLEKLIPAPSFRNRPPWRIKKRLSWRRHSSRPFCGGLPSHALLCGLLCLPPSPPLRAADPLSLIVAAARGPAAPPAARTRLADFAIANAKTNDGALAQLALGLVEYEHNDFAGAVRDLTGLSARLPKITDYVNYYLASAQAQLEDQPGASTTLALPVWDSPLSPLKSRALLLRAEALTKSQHSGEAADLLQAAYKQLPQPDAALALASAYDARGENLQAAAYYQRVFYAYPVTPAAAAAATAMERLKVALGKSFPIPSAQQLIDRPSHWIEAHQYAKAKLELQSALPQLTGLDRDQAQVRIGLADLRGGNTAVALRYLKGLRLPQSELSAERDEYVVDCARHLNDDSLVNETLRDLEKHYPRSPWRLKALLGTANRYLVDHQPEKYEPLYRAAFDSFPSDTSTALSHWRIAWDAYISRKSDADRLMREQVSRYPGDTKASAAMYFLGRLAEDRQDPAAARAWYERITEVFPHYYYGLLARDHLTQKEISAAASAPEVAAWLGAITFPVPRKFVDSPDAATTIRIERARLLRAAGYNDFAETELRFGARNGAEPHLIAMELATAADTPAESLRAMKSTVQDYLSMAFDAAPMRFWQLLFPMPFRPALDEFAKQRDLDPFMVAGLIRQESEFNPTIRSHANAYGLTQIIPSTGRQLARMNGIKPFTIGLLLQPETNINLGTTYLRMLLDEWGGKWEETLASYNAGKSHVVNWVTWGQFREPAEFVESIPFNETHEYVQAVIRNAAIYRELYGKPR
jgi:soluble lytic murein transglycosylase